MPHLSPVPDESDRRPEGRRPQAAKVDDPRPLYRQVVEELEALAMRLELGDDRPLPPEGKLMERYRVSRGTLRRAVDELVREGLLRIEPGRGTFVDQACKVRWMVWDRLADIAIPDSRFDLDFTRYVPDFRGRQECDTTLVALPAYVESPTVFIAPDNSLEGVRRHALSVGKKVVVPTYGMRRGFVLLDGASIGEHDLSLAATLDGMERCGRVLGIDDLRGLGPVDLVITGAVAVTGRGLHVGGGDGYLDLEWGILRHLNLVTARTPVIVSVHDTQVLDVTLTAGPHDVIVDLIVTPTRVIECRPQTPKPDGLRWEEIRGSGSDSLPYMRALHAELAGGSTATGAAAPGGEGQ